VSVLSAVPVLCVFMCTVVANGNDDVSMSGDDCGCLVISCCLMTCQSKSEPKRKKTVGAFRFLLSECTYSRATQ